ncbi:MULTISPECIES: excalibur calcium-binding domain-containing protein [Streptosporangium]|uniref:Excalibur calcium-binding domain-containing protein n=1 Tax=Streptosporangium brasiliense TaxID=47480 RepID=A0ABT9QXA2_9ACTN|nr:excalibur calcium-binding domain-containing protein [Streptosporangium brasiliense]MDP9861599.1 hypothetical protein [Streptosporangium brasiliense]
MGPRGPRGPGAGPGGGAPVDPRASRVTTVVLIVALVVVVMITGVLGTLAVLMTRNPDVPLGAAPPARLPVPIHFAPVTGSQPGACTSPDGMPDDAGQTCYTLAGGVSVTAVHKIETVQEKNGAYSVRIAFAPAFRDQINDLTQEAVKQQIAIVVGEKVVAAPRVAQVITEDSLSIAGSFTKEQADAMVARLRGTAPSTGQPQPSSDQPVTPQSPAAPTGTAPTGTAPTGTAPTGTAPTGTAPTGTAPTGTAPTGTAPTGTAPTGTAPTGTAPTGTAQPGAGRATTAPTGTATAATPVPTGSRSSATAGSRNAAPAAGRGDLDPRFPNCKAAYKEGYGPYYQERHKEYRWYVDKDRDGVACDLDDMA